MVFLTYHVLFIGTIITSQATGTQTGKGGKVQLSLPVARTISPVATPNCFESPLQLSGVCEGAALVDCGTLRSFAEVFAVVEAAL